MDPVLGCMFGSAMRFSTKDGRRSRNRTAYDARMAPRADQVRSAVERHCQLWNERRQPEWEALFADEVTFDDPVGAPTKHGREAVRSSWERSLTPGREWRLVPTRIVVCADEAAVLMRNEGTLHGERVDVDSIEIWKVDDAGLVIAVRAYFQSDPDVQSDYFVAD
jgi:steroid delta-isomerase